MASTMNRPRKRFYMGRSRNGCLACRMRHVKCDEGRPVCDNCHRGDRICIVEDKAIISAVQPLKLSTLGSTRSSQDEAIFYRFTKKLAPMLEVFQTSPFWTKDALAAAQSSPQAFDALLALQTLYDVPIVNIVQPKALAQRYRDAITWYSRSMKTSIQSIPQRQSIDEILLLLLNSYIYVLIELRQAHHENARALVCATFSVAHSARTCLLGSKSVLAFSCLEAMLNITLLGAFRSTSVERSQWTSVLAIASRIATDMNFSDSTQLKLDLLDVIYNVHQAVEGDISSEPGFLQVDQRLAQWYERLLQVEREPVADLMQRSRISLLRSMYLHIVVQWRTYFDNFDVDLDYIKGSLTELIVLSDRLTLGSVASDALAPLWTVEGAFVPICVAAAWHWRDPSLLALSTRYINTFRTPERTKWMTKVVSYIATLVDTPPYEPTALELSLFGKKPKAFLCWNVYSCVHHLLRAS